MSDKPSVDLERGEKVLRHIRSDRGRYWRDHGVLGLAGMAGVGIVLWIIGNEFVAIGALGAVLAVGVRALYLQSEQLGHSWWLTNRRLLFPGGRSVMLLEVETARRLFGDVQIITRSGDKHLIRHVADSAGLVTDVLAARDRRRKQAR